MTDEDIYDIDLMSDADCGCPHEPSNILKKRIYDTKIGNTSEIDDPFNNKNWKHKNKIIHY